MRKIPGSFTISPVSKEDLPALLEVYRMCEDFLALGPTAQASPAMVLSDLELSAAQGGIFCGIFDPSTQALLGVLDYLPGDFPDRLPYISLLMIAAPQRGQGLGAAVMADLEARLLLRAPFTAIEASVQVNNPRALRFWQRQGFQVISQPELQSDGTVAVRMRKSLPTPRA